MNYIKALIVSAELWKWLSQNPGCLKEEYPLYLDLEIYDMVGECGLCHYHDTEDDDVIDYKPKCEECILYEEDVEKRNNMMWPCSRHFVEWHESNDRESALKIYSIIQKELDEQDVEELL